MSYPCKTRLPHNFKIMATLSFVRRRTMIKTDDDKNDRHSRHQTIKLNSKNIVIQIGTSPAFCT